MSTPTRSGFTIIEVMLFLAITGALTIAILVGSGAAIGQQRYRDSVNSFKGLVQEQYSQIANVINSEVQNPVCSPSGAALLFSGESGQSRGTSECLVIGRFLLVEPTKVTTYNLIGQPPTGATGSDDSTTLRGYAVAAQSPEAYEISWGARIVEPRTEDGSTTSVLIVRSPLSGSILTYVQDGDHLSSIRGMIDDDNMVQKDFCIDSSGGLSALARRQAVRINAKAANQGAIEIPLEEDNVCD